MEGMAISASPVAASMMAVSMSNRFMALRAEGLPYEYLLSDGLTIGLDYCAAVLASWVFCWRSFSSPAVIFGGSSLMVSLSSLPVKRNGGW